MQKDNDALFLFNFICVPHWEIFSWVINNKLIVRNLDMHYLFNINKAILTIEYLENINKIKFSSEKINYKCVKKFVVKINYRENAQSLE